MEQEILRSDWAEFLNSFTRRHKNWLITVRLGQIEILRNQPLKEVRLTEQGISIQAGERSAFIERPLSIHLVKTREGADQSIQVVSDDAINTILIDTPTLPELVDGI